MTKTSFLDTALVRDPRCAAVEDGDLLVVLPLRGQALAFDVASRTLLECFDESATPREIADDLVAGAGLDQHAANQIVERVAVTLLRSGHLYKSEHGPRRFGANYPPTASP